MQRVVQRAKRAGLKAARKVERVKKNQESDEAWNRNQNTQRLRKSLAQNIKNEKIARRENWELGPLAPRRDVGEHKDTYGSLPMWDSMNPELHPNQRPKWLHITEGDRVVVVKGRDKGKIGQVTDVSKDRGTVRVKGVAEQLVNFPEWMVAEEERGLQDNVTQIPADILIQNVRLVYPLKDPKTKIPRDVIIDHVIKGPSRYDRPLYHRDGTRNLEAKLLPPERLVGGAGIIIPWPEKADADHMDHDADTIQSEVEYHSYTPTLIYPPMPTSVLDELRNKYSKFRTRHDWDYVERLEKEDAKSEKRKGLVNSMRTPLKELADLRAQQKKQAEKELSEEQLEKIGAVIHHAQTSAGISTGTRIPTPE